MKEAAVSELYEATLFPQVNVLGLLALAGLLAAAPETVAVGALHLIYVAALAFSLYKLSGALGTSRWNAVFALLFAVNFNLFYGFISFCLGIPVLLYLVARLVEAGRSAAAEAVAQAGSSGAGGPPGASAAARSAGEGAGEPASGRAGTVAVASGGARTAGPTQAATIAIDAVLWLLLLLGHVILLVFGLLSLFMWMLLWQARPRDCVVRAFAVLPAVALLIAWQFGGGAALEPGAGLEYGWHGLGLKLAGAGLSLIVAGVKGTIEWAVIAVVCAASGFVLALELRRRGGGPRAKAGTAKSDRGREGLSQKKNDHARGGTVGANTWLPSPRMLLWVRLLALAALLLYAFLPYAVVSREHVTHGVFLFYNRFLVLVPLLFLPTLVWPSEKAPRRVLVAAVFVLHLALTWNLNALISGANEDAKGLDAAIEKMEPGKVLKSLIYTPYPEELNFPSFLHAGSYYQARKLGEVDQSFALLPPTAVHYRDHDRPYLSRGDEHLRPHLFDWQTVWAYDYVLIYDRGGGWREAYGPARLRRIHDRNGWIVLEVR